MKEIGIQPIGSVHSSSVGLERLRIKLHILPLVPEKSFYVHIHLSLSSPQIVAWV